MKFLPTFLFYNIEVYDPLICNFRVWASDKHIQIFSRDSKLANSSQNVRHSARGQNMQIGTLRYGNADVAKENRKLNDTSELHCA